MAPRDFLFKTLCKGYFPKELPPPFNTFKFALWASNNKDYISDLWAPFGNKQYVTRLVRHSLARPGANRRVLSIPNPLNQMRLVLAIQEHYDDLIAAVEKSSISSSRPEVHSKGRRAILPKYVSALSTHRARIRTGCRYIVKADISRFYPSIYTHSIPWALHGKERAKANHGRALFGNLLDLIVRNSQHNQTVGIPVGPDTSFLISEVIASSIDAELQKLESISGFRWYDDYELAFFDRSSAERSLSKLEHELNKFELDLNCDKTLIQEIPQPFEYTWVNQLRSIELAGRTEHQRDQLISLFSLAFELAPKHPKEGVLKYAVRKLYDTTRRSDEKPHLSVHRFNWPLTQHLIFQVALAEPDTIQYVLGLISFFTLFDYEIDKRSLEKTLNALILMSSNKGYSSDIAWALWGFIENRLSIPLECVKCATALDDDICSLLLLDAKSKGLISDQADWTQIEQRVLNSDFESDRWLLAYESTVKGWLSPEYSVKIKESAHYMKLSEQGVSFYQEDCRAYGSSRHIFGSPSWLYPLIAEEQLEI